jgi:Arc/MetJ family transcription regulator
MYVSLMYYASMIKRTTIEIDQQLLDRAKRALDCPTTRATVEEALRRAAEQAEDEQKRRAAQLDYFLRTLPEHVDMDVLASDEMWR